MIKNFLMTGCSIIMLSACANPLADLANMSGPKFWTSDTQDFITIDETSMDQLKQWWLRFDDETLNTMIDMALANNPDRNIAQSKIREARAIRKTTQSTLFPQIGASANVGRTDNGVAIDETYQAGFDASYELDVFGVNRNNLSAANARIQTLQNQYHDISLTLIAEVARTYIDYRSAQKQTDIANKNLKIQTNTLNLIRKQYKVGEITKLDVERAESLVNTTAASIPEFQRQADNARLQLTILTGEMPAKILNIASNAKDINAFNIEPILSTPTSVMNVRPDIRAATTNLGEKSSLTKAAAASLFPTFSIEGFFGIAKSAVFASDTIWNVAAGTAVSLLNFGRIEGQIDAAREREIQAFELYKKTILNAVTEVETAISDYSRVNTQSLSIQKAYKNAENALYLSQRLYTEGEISFLDILDAQRTLNEADAARVRTKQSEIQSIIRLYKALGVY